LDGKAVDPAERAKALLEVPEHLKGIAEGASVLTKLTPELSEAFANVAERLGTVNPLMIGAQVTYQELDWLTKNVYFPSRQALSGALLHDFLGQDPGAMMQSLRSTQVTDLNANGVIRSLLLDTFDQGGTTAMPATAQKPWSRFLHRNLSAADVNNLKMMAAHPEVDFSGMRSSYAEKLQQLAMQFLSEQVKAAS
jgi:hypothetical protein